MAGRPRTRAKRLREAQEAGKGEVELLTPDAIEQIEKGERTPPGGNGSWPSFSELGKEELAALRAKSVESRRRKAELKKLGEMQAWYEANKELAGLVFGARVSLLEGLLKKGMGSDGAIDPSLLEKHEMDNLIKLTESYNDRMYGKAAQRIEHSGNVEVQHRVAQFLEGIEDGEG